MSVVVLQGPRDARGRNTFKSRFRQKWWILRDVISWFLRYINKWERMHPSAQVPPCGYPMSCSGQRHLGPARLNEFFRIDHDCTTYLIHNSIHCICNWIGCPVMLFWCYQVTLAWSHSSSCREREKVTLHVWNGSDLSNILLPIQLFTNLIHCKNHLICTETSYGLK